MLPSVSFPRLPARPRHRRRWARSAMLLAALALVAGCSGPSGDVPPAAARETATAPATTATTATTSTATSARPVADGPRPLMPYEVIVAEVRPEIAELATFDSPGGTRFTPELAQINPWYFGGPLVLRVVSGLETDTWLEVALASRPNEITAWIHASDVTLSRHRFHITIAVGDRMLRAYEADTLLLETPIVVGRPNTPTPLGMFFVNAEIPQDRPGGAYGPVILSVSAFSEVLESFDGGLPEIGLHGTNEPALVGSASSNGCIRMPNEAIVQLESLVPVGTVVNFIA